mmetsp:Transcript_20414/g.42684  ORF Transcript_20414/g.42684 Transcript_20414/m.42684 type:complete len:120 (+) Transcript_20414:1329-1688(+)
MPGMHPLVRNLYKRAIIVGKDYPHPDGLEYVRRKWKKALRDPENCQLVVDPNPDNATANENKNERIIRKAVGRGRYVIREMEGTIQLKKYRTMRRRYGEGVDVTGETNRIGKSLYDMFK